MTATTTLTLKRVNLERRAIVQDARDVETKGAKTFSTAFYIIAEDVWEAFAEWVDYLQSEKLFGLADPLFPATSHGLLEGGGFGITGVSREPWQQTQSIRGIVNGAFERVGIPPYGPHSFRNMLTHIGMKICPTPHELKAWSQNFGHANVLTTLTSYGKLTAREQIEAITTLPRWETTRPGALGFL